MSKKILMGIFNPFDWFSISLQKEALSHQIGDAGPPKAQISNICSEDN